MKKTLFFFSFFTFFSTQCMERARQRIKSDSLFQSAQYEAFLNCYFQGKDNPDNRICFMNFCARDKVWSMYKTFLDNGGAEIVRIANNSASFSEREFKLIKEKLLELHEGLGQACELLKKLERDKEECDGRKKVDF